MKCPTSGAMPKSVLYHRFRWSRLITSNRGSVKVGQPTIIAESTVWHAFGPYPLSRLGRGYRTESCQNPGIARKGGSDPCQDFSGEFDLQYS